MSAVRQSFSLWGILLHLSSMFYYLLLIYLLLKFFYLKYIQKCLEISSVPGIRTIGFYIQFQSNKFPTNGSPELVPRGRGRQEQGEGGKCHKGHSAKVSNVSMFFLHALQARPGQAWSAQKSSCWTVGYTPLQKCDLYKYSELTVEGWQLT